LSEGRERGQSTGIPKLLVTGFGPFPGAPENPTEVLMRSLAAEPPESNINAEDLNESSDGDDD